MPLRTTAYATLAAQDLLKRHSVLRRPGALTAVSMVLHHGADRWTAPTRIQDLVPGLDEYALAGPEAVDPDEARAENVPGLLLGLLVPGQPAADLDRRLHAISRALEHDPQLRFEIAEELLSPLSSLFDHPMLKEKLKEAGVTTWLEVLTESRDRDRREARHEGRREGRREGRQAGRREGQARMIARLVTQRFGPETARTLSRMIVGVADADLLDSVADAVVACPDGAEFLACVRGVIGANEAD